MGFDLSDICLLLGFWDFQFTPAMETNLSLRQKYVVNIKHLTPMFHQLTMPSSIMWANFEDFKLFSA